MAQKATRHRAKRKLSSARNNISMCGSHIFEISEIYREYHPDISGRLDTILTILLEADKMIDMVEKGI